MHFVIFSVLLLYGQSVWGLNFDMNNVIEVKLATSDVVERSYFGYSLLLQKGTNPTVIVGAPHQSNVTGGAIFSCDCSGRRSCSLYDIKLANNGSFNGNFLGSSLDGAETVGDSFVVCAPRLTTVAYFRSTMHFVQRGQCLQYSNSSSLNAKKEPIGQFFIGGFESPQTGFDFSYNLGSNTLVIGAVGTKNWTGSLASWHLEKSVASNKMAIPTLADRTRKDYAEYNYLGYKVGFAKYQGKEYIVAGAPRGANLNGKVLFFDKTKLNESFYGDKIGSYFGAAFLAVDVNNDNSDELFIGAPTTPGATFDEGCVYYYKNIGVKMFTFKLEGSRKRGARFGANIVSLGDVDLDSYNDIAIAAPFEDDGLGAVYIYMGTSNGIKNIFTQRLSPSIFSGHYGNIKGFGMGLSRGVDINNNGFNDLAVGAYRSGQVFILPTKEVIDFIITLRPNVTAITTDNITLDYCVAVIPRYEASNLQSVDFTMTLITGGSVNYSENVTCLLQTRVCRTVNTTAEQREGEFVPFQVSLMTKAIGNIVAVGKNLVELSIPFAHGCNDDNICQTNISIIEIQPKSESIVLGQHKTLKVKLAAQNLGEPGYQCEVYVALPKEIEVETKCNIKNGSYICLFAHKLDSNATKEVEINFQFAPSDDLTSRSISIDFELKCLGINLNGPIATQVSVNVDIHVQNSLYVEGKSSRDDIEYFPEDSINEKIHEIVHTYTVGNFGPSPAKTDLYILVPIVKVHGEDLFEFVETKNNINGNQVRCSPTNNIPEYDQKYNVTSIIKAPLEMTKIVDCFQEWDCMKLLCEGEVLYLSSKTTKFLVKLKTKTNLLAQFLLDQEQSKSIIAYTSSAFAYNGTLIDAHVSTLILSSKSKEVPIWVYVVATIIGCLLLVLLIFLLFKCDFFERNYRDKLQEERQLISAMEGNFVEEEEVPLEIVDDGGEVEHL